VIKSIVETLYILSGETKDDFCNRVIVKPVKYDISNVKRIYPYFSSFDEAAKYFHGVFPQVLNSEMLIVADSERLKTGICTFIRSTYKLQPQNQITGFYEEPQDFILHSRYQMIFTTERDVYRVFHYLHHENELRVSNYKNILRFGQEPYFLNNNDKLYLAQPVLLGEKARALTIVRRWLAYGINSGYYTHIDDKVGDLTTEIPEIVQYDNNKLILTSSIIKQNDQYIAILEL
jgi:hypothetical protein